MALAASGGPVIASIIALVSKVLEIIWPSKTAEKVATDDGYSAGVSAQKSADQSQTLKDVADAKAAADSVDRANAGGVSVASDGFRRD